MANAKDSYQQLCESEETIPIFLRPWWLDASVGGAGWDVVLHSEGGEVVGALPFTIRRSYGLTLLGQPHLTQFLGPWLRERPGNYSRRLGNEMKWLGNLLGELPRFDRYLQNWHWKITNWLPAYWEGFQQSTRYTYRIEPLVDPEETLQQFSSSYRNKLRKASNLVQVRTDLSIREFYRLNQLTFQRQSLKAPFSLSQVLRLHQALIDHGCGKIFHATDAGGRVHSALLLIWDQNSAYVHLVGEDPELRNSGAGILLVAEAIRYAASTLSVAAFDFEGSMLRNVEQVRRGCGGVQVPYFQVSKAPSKLIRTLSFLREIGGGSR